MMAALPPSTVAAVASILVTCVSFLPLEEYDLKSVSVFGSLIKFSHLVASCGWLGAQVYVTFIAGITMFRNLPRHTFGNLQSKLFPQFFSLGAILTSIALLTFVIDHPYHSWNFQLKIQGYCLVVTLLMVLLNIVYLVPANIHVMFKKHTYEKELKAGVATGDLEKDKLELLSKNPDYMKLSRRFAMLHGISSLSNLAGLIAELIHIWYLSGNLQNL